MASSAHRIDPERLETLLAGLNTFGRNAATGGFNRSGYGDADMAARAWFADTLRADGLAVHRDGAGNVFGRFGPADGPSVMVGSHLDTVPDGGAFDGALGVAVALECVRAMKDAGLRPRTAVEVVATAEEEGRFGGMLGSQAIAGRVRRNWLETAADADGVTLVAALHAAGLDAQGVLSAARPAGSVRAFLELHIEQGPVLEAAGVSVGIADRVSGVCHLSVRLAGRANHSGTTPMAMRADAFAGLAEVAAAIPDVIAARGTDQSRITIGRVALQPNAPHTIPGLADFSLVIRDTDEAVMRVLNDAMLAAIADAARRHSLDIVVDEKSWLPPVALDPAIAGLLSEEARRLGLAAVTLPSGAGHDAQTMQALCPCGLVFVPSRGGISHAPEEHTAREDIEKGATLMLAALVRLAEAA